MNDRAEDATNVGAVILEQPPLPIPQTIERKDASVNDRTAPICDLAFLDTYADADDIDLSDLLAINDPNEPLYSDPDLDLALDLLFPS